MTPQLKNASRYTNIIFDLGDVLFTWSASAPRSPVPADIILKILRSFHWMEYEKGNLEEAEVYSLVAKEFSVTSEDVKAAFQAARDSLQANPQMLDVIRQLKEAGLKIYAMSNISAPDWAVLSTKAADEDWELFSRTFTSAAAGERKPNIGFFEKVIEKARIDPSSTIFVDDKLENVLTARSFGMHGIIFRDQSKVIKELKNLCFDPVGRGQEYLVSHKQNFSSVTSNGLTIDENFAQLLILEATGDKNMVDYAKSSSHFNFFKSSTVPSNSRESFPNDMDTTSIGLTVTDHVDLASKLAVMDEMLKYRNSDGIIQVYFDHSRPRIDPVVCVNVLTLFYSNGRGQELFETLNWVEKILVNRAYISGTYYYHGADQFLFFLSRLIQASSYVQQRLGPVFKERIVERFGIEADSLSLAGRIIAAAAVNIEDKRDLETLLSMQSEDGSWGDGWFYRYASSGILIKNDGVSTALALKAIQLVNSTP
ncbi:HAD-like protein [Crepidotus variabilis]|uniref:HAD-like protein n=1 Tax=Crepidotus variabilis TaxID=179855 RepID=A0A9P6JT32_9AGAR|nr:HAD-like protein [Crepidotus variabilis]